MHAHVTGALSNWLAADYTGETCPDGLIVSGPLVSRMSAIVYTSLLLYTFLGVMLSADLFMTAIERITSQAHDAPPSARYEPSPLTRAPH
eukprot:2671912-Prymnesium_polylepis.1